MFEPPTGLTCNSSSTQKVHENLKQLPACTVQLHNAHITTKIERNNATQKMMKRRGGGLILRFLRKG
jgi:hypothetical protein